MKKVLIELPKRLNDLVDDYRKTFRDRYGKKTTKNDSVILCMDLGVKGLEEQTKKMKDEIAEYESAGVHCV